MRTKELMQKPEHKNNQRGERGTASKAIEIRKLRAKATAVRRIDIDQQIDEATEELQKYLDDPDGRCWGIW